MGRVLLPEGADCVGHGKGAEVVVVGVTGVVVIGTGVTGAAVVVCFFLGIVILSF
jgi:hypothetical protein